jgi:hypothetical protein
VSERAGATKKTSLSVRQNTTGAPIPLSPLVHLRITRSTRIYIEHLNIVVIIIIIIVVAIPPPLSSSTRLSQAYLNLLSSSWTPPPLVRTGLNLGTDSLFTYKHSGRLPVLVLVLVVICNSYPPPPLLSLVHLRISRSIASASNTSISSSSSSQFLLLLSLFTYKSLTSLS